MAETDLYPPVKRFLEAQGYVVKAEVADADVVALRADEPPVIVELKSAFSLALIRQGIDRQAVTPHVYLAVPRPAGRRGWSALRANLRLARRLGLGVLAVRGDVVEPLCDPGPFRPRLLARPRERLLREFAARRGDPNRGGTRGPIVTAYRQDALRLAAHLARAGPCRGAAARDATGVARATTMLRDDHYGWFRRVERGVYAVTEAGRAAAARASEPAE